MNKENIIKIDESDITLENITGCLQITQEQTIINLKGTNQITGILLPTNAKLTLNLADDSKNRIEDYWTHQNTHCRIQMNSSNHTVLNLNISIEAERDYNLTLENKILGNKNNTKIKIHVVTTKKGNCSIKSIGTIESNTLDNHFLEELKGLYLENKNITFYPDLIVNSNAVSASHNATIKCLNKEELFYLYTKGIDEKTAKELIKDGFLNKKREGGEK